MVEAPFRDITVVNHIQECQHHYKVESLHGEKVNLGVCQNCQNVREFPATWDDLLSASGTERFAPKVGRGRLNFLDDVGNSYTALFEERELRKLLSTKEDVEL